MNLNKMYNVILNSTYCTADTVLNTVNNKNYYIDWSAVLPDKNFRLTFSFVSEVNYIDTLTEIPMVSIDFLNQGNVNICQQKYQSTKSNILGIVFPINIDQTNKHAYFRADQSFNPPVYLARPRNNNFNVQIISNNNPPDLWLDDAILPDPIANYVLILSFEECP